MANLDFKIHKSFKEDIAIAPQFKVEWEKTKFWLGSSGAQSMLECVGMWQLLTESYEAVNLMVGS